MRDGLREQARDREADVRCVPRDLGDVLRELIVHAEQVSPPETLAALRGMLAEHEAATA